MLRLFVLAILLLLAVIEYKKPMKPFVFPAVFSLLTLMFALRCGQGTDYFSYAQIYTDPGASGQEYEIGYTLLNDWGRALGIPFTVFVFIYSLIVMGLLCLLLYKACSHKFMGLFVMYALYYLQFFESSFRQVLAMVLILLGYWLTASKNRVWFALVAIALAFTLHTSALVSLLFFIPYLFEKSKKLKAWVDRHTLVVRLLLGLICLGMIGISFTPLFNRLQNMLPASLASRLSFYFENSSHSIMSLLSRMAFLGLIILLYWGSRRKVSRAEHIFFHTYLLGFVIYCVLFRFDLIASRLNAYYKITEIVLIPNLLGYFNPEELRLPGFLEARKGRKLTEAGVLAVTALLLSFMYVKTTKDVMGQSLYDNPGYIYPYYNVWTVDDMYTIRHAPNYAHREFYTLLDKANPRLIGDGDTLSQNYISAIPNPWEWAISDYVQTVTDYAIADPLTRDGSLVSLLGENYQPEVYTEGMEVVSPTPTPEKKIPIKWETERNEESKR